MVVTHLDVLNRIVELRQERNWTECHLAEKSGLTQSTISSWYRKNTLPTITSLEKIYSAFGITLSQLFLEESSDNISLTEEQVELIKNASKLNEEQFAALLNFLQKL